MTERQVTTKVVDDSELYDWLAEEGDLADVSEPFDIVAFLSEHGLLREQAAPYRVQRPTRTVELEGQAVGDSLVLTAPEGVALPFTLAGNPLSLGGYRIVLRGKGPALPARP